MHSNPASLSEHARDHLAAQTGTSVIVQRPALLEDRTGNMGVEAPRVPGIAAMLTTPRIANPLRDGGRALRLSESGRILVRAQRLDVPGDVDAVDHRTSQLSAVLPSADFRAFAAMVRPGRTELAARAGIAGEQHDRAGRKHRVLFAAGEPDESALERFAQGIDHVRGKQWELVQEQHDVTLFYRAARNVGVGGDGGRVQPTSKGRTMTTATEVSPAALEDPRRYPLRPCEPWCDKGNQHADEHPVDRQCWSPFEIVTLRHHSVSGDFRDGWWADYLNVFLRRDPLAESPHIVIHHEEADQEIRMSLAEASELADYLIRLLALAGGAA